MLILWSLACSRRSLAHVIPLAGRHYYHPCFTEEDAKAQRGKVIFPKWAALLHIMCSELCEVPHSLIW